MTRLPPLSNEPARIEAIMAIIGAEIRRHLGGQRKARGFNMLDAARALEATGLSALEPLPDYDELKPDCIVDESLNLMAMQETAVPPPNGPAVSPSQMPDEKRNFRRNFLSPVKQPEPLSTAMTYAEKIIRRDEAAKILGVSLRWFDHNIKHLLDDHAFPPPRDATGQRRWRTGDIVYWRETNPDAATILRRARAAHAKTMEKA